MSESNTSDFEVSYESDEASPRDEDLSEGEEVGDLGGGGTMLRSRTIRDGRRRSISL